MGRQVLNLWIVMSIVLYDSFCSVLDEYCTAGSCSFCRNSECFKCDLPSQSSCNGVSTQVCSCSLQCTLQDLSYDVIYTIDISNLRYVTVKPAICNGKLMIICMFAV